MGIEEIKLRNVKEIIPIDSMNIKKSGKLSIRPELLNGESDLFLVICKREKK